MAYLELDELTKHYGAVIAADHVSLGVKQGEFLTLLGPSGSGKTTLLMMVAGFVKPDHGSMLLDGQDLTVGNGNLAITVVAGTTLTVTYRVTIP